MRVASVRLLLITVLLGLISGCDQEPVRIPSSGFHFSKPKPLAAGKVLVVHSYHRDYEWTAGVSRGIRLAFEKTDIQLETFYMDTKRKTDVAWKEKAGRIALNTVETWQPDVVIAADDNAQQYFARFLVGRETPKVVFCGVNCRPSDYGYPASNVTGISQKPFCSETISLLQRIKPDISSVAIITDDSPTSIGTLEQLRECETQQQIACWKIAGTFDSWKKQILEAQEQVDAIVIYTYHTLKHDDLPASMSPHEVISWTVANSRIPLAGLLSFAIDDGVLCGVAESAVAHGQDAGEMARRILTGVDPKDIPITTSSKWQSMVNLNAARRLGIEIPKEVLDSVDIIVGETRAR